jgi:hypothetical protein
MRALIASLGLCLAGCQQDPYGWAYTTKKPDAADLVGNYAPDDATLKLIAEHGHYPPRPASIVLDASGRVTVTDIPDWWLTDLGRSQGGFDSGSGTWSVQPHQEWWIIGATFDSMNGFASQNHRSGGLVTGFGLVGERPPYKIHLTLGDPDDGQAMEFVRLSSGSK